MSRALKHARHNKQACDLFHNNGDFPDWVITTAFYCAMHYAYSIIFPLQDGNKTYTDIESYADDHKHHHTKHASTVHLITVKHFAISSAYKLLKDAAHTARYHDYEHPRPVVAKIRKSLDKIIEYSEGEYLKLHPTTIVKPKSQEPSEAQTAKST